MTALSQCRAAFPASRWLTTWGGYSGYIADPDGFLWEIAHNPFLQKLRG